MFDQLFTCPEATARHRSAPLYDARVQFLQHCRASGSPRGTLRRKARELLVIIEQLRLRPEGLIRPDAIRAAAQHWAYRQPSHFKLKDAEKARGHFIRAATRWLGFLGRLQAPPAPAYQRLVEAFARYLEDEQGLSPLTIRTECGHIGRFLSRQWAAGRSLATVAIQHIDAAIAEKGRRDGCCRASIRCYAASLRAFFRYAEAQGWCAPGLAAAILAPTVYRHESLPAGPSWVVVQQVLQDTAGTRPVEIRDHAILLLLAVYGLRSEEIQALQLADLGWDREVLTVVRPKARRTQQFPLTSAVGDAILRYLQEVRGHRPARHVFLTLRAPYGPLSRSALWKVVSERLRPLQTSLRHLGPHALRHACATHLLAQGLSMKAIGDQLGHRDPDSTCRYAKVDLAGLREVAEFDLGGLR